MGLWQSTFDAIYPPTCAMCDADTETTGALCGPCWRETPFIGACLCDLCGTALDGEAAEDLRCDDCLTIPRPWTKGRAALAYDGRARDMVLRLKHFNADLTGWEEKDDMVTFRLLGLEPCAAYFHGLTLRCADAERPGEGLVAAVRMQSGGELLFRFEAM